MMDDQSFTKLSREIQSLGYDEATADYYAARISDHPIRDGQGKIIVQNRTGEEITRLKLTFFDK